MSLDAESLADIRYECPVCLDPLFPPIYQCHNGHLLCQKCYPLLVNCALCRARLPEAHIRFRNLEIERIIRLIQHSCPHKDDGCNATVKFEQLEEHIQDCKYTKFPICNKVLGHDCEEMRLTDFTQHLETVHGMEILDTLLNSVVSHFGSCTRLTLMQRYTGVLRFRCAGKQIIGVMIAEHDSASDLMTWKPYILADGALRNRICCKILFYTNGNKLVQELEAPTLKLQSEPEDLQACLSLPLKYVQQIILSTPLASAGNEGQCTIAFQFTERTEILLNESSE